MTRGHWLLALAAAVTLMATVRWYHRWHWRDDREGRDPREW
jgi:hypothetical protein